MITPLCKGVWERELAGHPDRTLAETIVKGVAEGFKIGYNAQKVKLEENGKNM